MDIFIVILTVFIFLTPLICIPYIIYKTFESIWVGLVLYDKNKGNNLKWNMQYIIISSFTVLFAYLNATKINDDLYSNVFGAESLFMYYTRFLIYPSLLFNYYIALMIIHYFTRLKGASIKEMLTEKLYSDPSSKNYIKLSRFILASIFFSMWWVVISWYCIALGSWGQN